MIIRMFKPGDRVQRNGSGPVMIVQHYARQYSPFVGWYECDHSVVCSWYEDDGYHNEVIHQNNLTKVNHHPSIHSNQVNRSGFRQGMGT